MTKQDLLSLCLDTYGTPPDYPFEGDFDTTVLRHTLSRKWYAIIMKVPRRKLGLSSDETVDVVNLKLPTELYGSFTPADGVYPAYHMNKLHWISVILSDVGDETLSFLVSVSFDATGKGKPRPKAKG